MAVDGIARAYASIAGFGAPNPMQHAVWQHICHGSWGVGLLLKAPTGSGKTEAVAVPSLAAGDRRLIMVYPTRSLVDDQIARLQAMLCRRSRDNGGRALTLVVDTGAESRRYAWKHGQQADVTGNPRRHLYQGDVIVTTLDKFLYRFFGFGEPRKSYIYPLRIHYGARRTLICFDEAHAYDDVAFTNFTRLVRTLYGKGIDIALMTATMPAAFAADFHYLEQIDFLESPANRQALAEFVAQDSPPSKHPDKRLTYVPAPIDADEEDAVSPIANVIVDLAQSRYVPGRRLIVAAERVKDAAAIFLQLEKALPDAEVLLYHGRLTAGRRAAVYDRVRVLEQEDGAYVLVTTSAIEVGCDLNAHVLITQLCDPERLIQRAGRCNRRQQMADAEVVVVGDSIPQWLSALRPDDLEHYITVLRQQDGGRVDTLELANCIRKRPNLDYRVEMMFDMLYEYVYEARLENKGLHDRGLVVTRSWEPSLILCTGEDPRGVPLDAIEVPMSRCVARRGEPLTPMSWVYKQTFDPVEHRPRQSGLGRWECAYSTDVVVQLKDYPFDSRLGYVELPRVFNYSFRAGYRRVLVREDDRDISRVWYLEPLGATSEPVQEPEALAKVLDDSGGDDAD